MPSSSSPLHSPTSGSSDQPLDTATSQHWMHKAQQRQKYRGHSLVPQGPPVSHLTSRKSRDEPWLPAGCRRNFLHRLVLMRKAWFPCCWHSSVPLWDLSLQGSFSKEVNCRFHGGILRSPGGFPSPCEAGLHVYEMAAFWKLQIQAPSSSAHHQVGAFTGKPKS